MGELIFSLFALLKYSKVGIMLISMLISLLVYAQLYGWAYAAGFLGLLFIHEMGHYAAARRRGLRVSAPTFIPFIGAYVTLKDQPHDVQTEAYVAYAGPLAGTLASLVVYVYARQMNSELWLAVSYSGFFLNFFNLLPVSPLDGGRITAILSPRIWLIGAPLMVVLFFFMPSPTLLIIALVALPRLREAWHYDAKAPQNVAYYSVPSLVRTDYAIIYLGLAAFLGVMTYHVHQMLVA